MKQPYLTMCTGLAIAGWLGVSGCAPSQPPTRSVMSGPVIDKYPAATRSDRLQSARTGSENLPLGSQQQSSLDALRSGDSLRAAGDRAVREIYFDFDHYDLDTEDRATLRANAEWLKRNPATRIEIEGHCDERGTTEYNLALGAKRAQAAKDYLTSLGVSAQRISTISYGEEIPACRSHSENCWQQNRRDRFVTRAGGPVS